MARLSALRRVAKTHTRLVPFVLGIMIAGLAIAGGIVVLSNILVFPGTVSSQMTLTSPVMPANNTNINWFIGAPRNVSTTVAPNGYSGNAHVVYEVDATGIVCGNVTLTPIPGSNDSATCTPGTNAITFITDSKSFNGVLNRFWKFDMTFNSAFSVVNLKIYVAAG